MPPVRPDQPSHSNCALCLTFTLNPCIHVLVSISSCLDRTVNCRSLNNLLRPWPSFTTSTTLDHVCAKFACNLFGSRSSRSITFLSWNVNIVTSTIVSSMHLSFSSRLVCKLNQNLFNLPGPTIRVCASPSVGDQRSWRWWTTRIRTSRGHEGLSQD